MQPKRVKLTDYMLDRVVGVHKRLQDIEVEIEYIFECHKEWQDLHSVYLEHKKAVSDAKNNIDKYIKALRAEPNMAEILDTVERVMVQRDRLLDEDPILAAIQSELLEIDSIVNHGKRPWVARVNKAEQACQEWEAYMQTPEVQEIVAQAMRVKPPTNDDNKRKHILSDEEKEWVAYMSLK